MRRASVLVVSLTVTGLALAACGSSGGGTAPAGAQKIGVTLNDKGCDLEKSSVEAGPVTFSVSNSGSGAVTEAELLNGKTIIGEKENIAPGLSGTFSLNLKPGAYTMHCPGGSGPESVDLTVTGTATTASGNPQQVAALKAATTAYADYVRTQTAALVTGTKAFAAAVEAGDIAKAKTLYSAPRAAYESIEPVAESFGDLDPDIDARIDDVDDVASWTGFHRIEKALWADDDLAGMTPIAQKLVADTEKLQSLVKTLTYQPAQLANGATELLNEVGKTKITGEEERYSHLDMLDMKGNVDGAQKAFELLKPGLMLTDAALATRVQARFDDMQAAMKPYLRGSGPDGGESVVDYRQITSAQRRVLAQDVDALAEPLSQVAGVVVA